MLTKIKLLILSFLIISTAANAQSISILKRVPKPTSIIHYIGFNAIGDTVLTGPAVTQNLIRPVANIASYTIPGNSLLSGAGIAYEHLKWNATTARWDEVWSINALAWDKASLSGGSSQFAYGVAAGILGKGLIGIAPTDMKSFFLTLGLKINFNN